MDFKIITPWFLIICTILLITSIISNVFQMVKAQKRLDQAEIKVSSLEREQSKLIQDKTAQNSNQYIESQIRNKLKMVKSGETLVVVPEQLKSSQEESVYKYAPSEEKEIVKKQPIREWVELFL